MSIIRTWARNRHAAAQRLEPYNEYGDRDPAEQARIEARTHKSPQIVLTMLDTLPGGTLSREEARAAWPLANEQQRHALAAYFQAGGAA